MTHPLGINSPVILVSFPRHEDWEERIAPLLSLRRVRRNKRCSADLRGPGHAARPAEPEVNIRINQINVDGKHSRLSVTARRLYHQYSVCARFRSREEKKEQLVFYLFDRTDAEQQKCSSCVWNSALSCCFFHHPCHFRCSHGARPGPTGQKKSL